MPEGTSALILHFVVTSSQRTSKGAELQLQLTSGLKGAPKLARRSVGRRQHRAHCEMPRGRVDAHDERERILKDLQVNIQMCAYQCDVGYMIEEGPSSLWGNVHDISCHKTKTRRLIPLPTAMLTSHPTPSTPGRSAPHRCRRRPAAPRRRPPCDLRPRGAPLLALVLRPGSYAAAGHTKQLRRIDLKGNAVHSGGLQTYCGVLCGSVISSPSHGQETRFSGSRVATRHLMCLCIPPKVTPPASQTIHLVPLDPQTLPSAPQRPRPRSRGPPAAPNHGPGRSAS